MADKKEYVYDVEEYSQDTRHYKITSNVKLTDEEVEQLSRNVESYLNKAKRYRTGLQLVSS